MGYKVGEARAVLPGDLIRERNYMQVETRIRWNMEGKVDSSRKDAYPALAASHHMSAGCAGTGGNIPRLPSRSERSFRKCSDRCRFLVSKKKRPITPGSPVSMASALGPYLFGITSSVTGSRPSKKAAAQISGQQLIPPLGPQLKFFVTPATFFPNNRLWCLIRTQMC